ncbi:Hypothetical_protein [Hexamita inflata]|uniref:Hypothetical_protein n=1 Tax=Hexamita inflata TaxID=28002 RepID=A0AA86UCT1_9EUKA|nr:Hypothetical protein HINF_LOCUS24573 [Hexamita inflata]
MSQNSDRSSQKSQTSVRKVLPPLRTKSSQSPKPVEQKPEEVEQEIILSLDELIDKYLVYAPQDKIKHLQNLNIFNENLNAILSDVLKFYENPDSQRVILNNLFKKTYEYIYPFSYKDFTLIFSLPSVSLILAKAGCTVSDFESSELALVNLILDNYEPLQNEIFEFLLQMEIQKSSSEIQLLRQIGAKMFTQKPPKMESARRPVSGKRSGRNYGAEEQVLARFGVLAFALVLSGCEMNEDMEWE